MPGRAALPTEAPIGGKEWRLMALSTKKHKAIAALLVEPNQALAAQSAGVGERTLARWLAEDNEFVSAVRDAEEAAISHAVRCLVQLTEDAVNVLGGVLKDEFATDGVKVRAAGLVLEQVVKLRELRDFEERIAALEGAINEQSR